MREIAHLLIKKVHRRRVAWKRMVVDYRFSRFGLQMVWKNNGILKVCWLSLYNAVK
jgi:hypothetical protein